MATPQKIDSNVTGLSYAEEISLKTLAETPVWYDAEPNSYSSFGGDIKTVARNPISTTRQNKKGVITDLDASGGYTTDFMQTNMQRLMQGFCFANAHEKPDTKPFNGASVLITAVAASTKTFAASAGLDKFKTGHIINNTGFINSANNGLDIVVSSTPTVLTVTTTCVDEASNINGRIEAVGFQFPAADVSLALSPVGVALNTTASDFTSIGLTVGEWIFLGGDAIINQFTANKPGYARIASIAAKSLLLNDTSWVPSSEVGTGKTIQMFFGKTVMNEPLASNIIRRSYHLERRLGNDGDGIQTEYLKGAIANELDINIPEANKMDATLNFVAMDYKTQSGDVGPIAGIHVLPTGEDAYNTSSDIYRTKLSIVDPLTFNPSPLFAFVTECKLKISNEVKPNKALGVLGAFDVTAGNFVVSGDITAFFSTNAACAAIRNNSDVSFNSIFAHKNCGFVIDIPLLGLGGGKLDIAKDEPIKLPLTMAACQNVAGYTFLTTFFNYLPTVAMPV